MHYTMIISVGAAMGALLVASGCGGSRSRCPCSPDDDRRANRDDRGDRDREDRDRGDRGDRGRDDRGDCGQRQRDRCGGDWDRGGCATREWGDRDWGDRGDRDWGDRERFGLAPVAFEACMGKKAGEECVLKRGAWEMKGLCSPLHHAQDDARLACAPPPSVWPTDGDGAKPPAAKPPAAKPPAGMPAAPPKR